MTNDLLETLCNVNFESYGSLVVSRIEQENGDLHILLDVIADEEPDVPPNIQITCWGIRETSVSPGQYFDLKTTDDHVLLWQFTEPHLLTSFYGKVEEPLSVVGALYERHLELVGHWIPIQKYLNPGVRLPELIGGSFGMLAEGPESLVLAYEEVLQRYGISTSSHLSREPVDNDLSVMILDHSYVIAAGFEASECD